LQPGWKAGLMGNVAGNEHPLIIELRRVHELIAELESRPLDAIDRERLVALKAQEARLREQAARAGLVPEKQSAGSGLWAPLPMADATAFAPVAVEPRRDSTTAAPFVSDVREVVPGQDDQQVLAALDELMSTRPARAVTRLRALANSPALSSRSLRIMAAAFEQLGSDADAEALRRRTLSLNAPAPRVPRADAVLNSVAAPFTPGIDDGFTEDQRVIVRVLAVRGRVFTALDELAVAVVGDGLSLERSDAALAELLLPRRYPILEVARDGKHVRLTSLAAAMGTVEDAAVRLHGGFFPNLIVNGCACVEVFPSHRLADVYSATRVLMRSPGAPIHELVEALRGPDLPEVSALASLPITLYRLGFGALELENLTRQTNQPVERTTTLVWVDDACARQAFDVIEGWRVDRAVDGLLRVGLEGRVVRVQLEHPVFAWSLKRALRRAGLVTRRTLAELRVVDGAIPRVCWLGELLYRFLENSRNEVRRRVEGKRTTSVDRRPELRALLRAVDDPAIQSVLDHCLGVGEAVWALTHLGTSAFRAHPVFGPIAVEGPPFDQRDAERIASTPRLAQRRSEWVQELEALEAASTAAGPSADAVDAMVLEEFERLLELVGDDPRRTVLPGRHRVV
jgi:hypothetical protein